MATSNIPARVCYPYYLSRDIKLDIKVKVSHAQGLVPGALTVSAVIKSAKRALHQSSKDTSLPTSVFPHVRWNEWLVFPVRYADLAPDAEIEFTLRDQGFKPVYRASLSLFEEHHLVLKVGAQRLRIRSLAAHANFQRTAEAVALEHDDDDFHSVEEVPRAVAEAEARSNETDYFRLKKLAEKHEKADDIFRTPWMERLLKERIEAERKDQLETDVMKSLHAHASDEADAMFALDEAADDSEHAAWLLVDLPLFRIPIIGSEKPYVRKAYAKPKRIVLDGDVNDMQLGQEWVAQVDPNTGKTFYQTGRDERQTWKSPEVPLDSDFGFGWEPSLSRFIEDPETDYSNPALQKTLRLFRSGNTSSQAKPNKEQAAAIENILKSPILKNTLQPLEASLLWQFRHVLCSRGDALVKFLYAVEKTDAHDTKQALDLLARWASVDVADALILLSDDFTHEPTIPSPLDDAVRRFAVQTLRKSASDADLRLYLLQLVQALRHEPDLKALQQRQQEQQEQQASTVVATDGSGGELASETPSAAENPSAADEPESLSPLADLLLERCVNNEELSNFFHWFVEVETHAHGVGELYSLVLRAFHNRLAKFAPDVYSQMSSEQELVMKFVALGTEIQSSGGVASTREKKMRALLGEGGAYGDLRQFDESIPMPHMPNVRVKGLIAEKTRVFKSALCPFVLTFIVDDVPAALNEARKEIQKTLMDSDDRNGDAADGGASVVSTPTDHAPLTKSESVDPSRVEDAAVKEPTLLKVMMKIGDDLRQDQLILQMIQLMDTILKRVNLDLKLSPYAVLAVSRSNGMLEFLSDSPMPLSAMKDIRKFLAEKHPSKETDVGIRPDILDTFVRSCAGAAVVTWILAVGDRHLDNIMLKTDTGCLVHIDFGYIFGKEPKQNVPNIRVTRAMVDAMGGPTSKYYNQFKNLAGQAFNILRRHANLILALLKLMAHADLEDCSADDFDVVQDRFLLGRSDEEAERHLISEIEFSVRHRWVAMMDILHEVATAMR